MPVVKNTSHLSYFVADAVSILHLKLLYILQTERGRFSGQNR